MSTVAAHHHLNASFVREPSVVFEWAVAPGGASTDAIADAIALELGRLIGGGLLSGMDRLLCSEHVREGLVRLQAWGVLRVVLPEVEALVGFHDTCPVHHKDLWSHTLTVLERLPADADLRWAALMHDAGKVGTRIVHEGRVSFLRHEATGAWLMDGVARRFAMSEQRARRIGEVIGKHGRVNAYRPDWSDRAVARLIRASGERLEDLLAFSAADYTTARARQARTIRSHLGELRRRVTELSAAKLELPPGLGDMVMAELGVEPGPEVGAALRWIRAHIAAGALAAGLSAAEYVDAFRQGQNG